jgi:hypothetical protein
MSNNNSCPSITGRNSNLGAVIIRNILILLALEG